MLLSILDWMSYKSIEFFVMMEVKVNICKDDNELQVTY